MSESRVLVVEDNQIIREVMLQYLNRLGLNCYSVTTGEESVELAEYFDLVLMDIELPGISGLEAAKQIRLREKRKGLQAVPVVATTSHDNRSECLAAGMNDHCCKPIFQEDLSRLLRQWLFEQPQKLRLLG